MCVLYLSWCTASTLAEILDYGYPQKTDSGILKTYITQQGVRTQVREGGRGRGREAGGEGGRGRGREGRGEGGREGGEKEGRRKGEGRKEGGGGKEGGRGR